MPKVISTLDFKKRMKENLESMDGYMIVANETFKDRSLVVVEPEVMVGLCIRSGNVNYAKGIVQAIDDIGKRVSEKYRKIRSIK